MLDRLAAPGRTVTVPTQEEVPSMWRDPSKWNMRLLVAILAMSVVAGLARPALAQTLVVKWNDVLLECVRRSRIGPPMVARAIGVTHTSGFDAWAMYDDVAVATRLG